MVCPLQLGVLKYAAEHEPELRAKAIEKMKEYLSSVPMEELKAKFLAGCEEHGPLDPLTDWTKELEDEAKDAFWYAAIPMFLLEKRE